MPRISYQLWIDTATKAKLDQIAADQGRPTAQLVRDALEAFMVGGKKVTHLRGSWGLE